MKETENAQDSKLLVTILRPSGEKRTPTDKMPGIEKLDVLIDVTDTRITPLPGGGFRAIVGGRNDQSPVDEAVRETRQQDGRFQAFVHRIRTVVVFRDKTASPNLQGQ